MSAALQTFPAPIPATGPSAGALRLFQTTLAAAWIHAGCLLRAKGRPALARIAFVRGLGLRPDLISGWLSLALIDRESGRFREAECHLRRAFALNPARPETLLAWARLRLARRDFAGAQGWIRWALAQAPDDAEAWNTLGIVLHAQGRFGEAVPAFEHAAALGSQPAISNRGNSLLELGRMDEAFAAHQSAVDRDPSHAGARYNLALTQLRLGHWSEGWRNYEARWGFREVHPQPRVFSRPRWQGELLDGERVLLHAEQGLGDTIQFCRYAALVAARGGHPILQVQSPVARLLDSLAVVRAGLAQVALLDDPPPPFDLECPLLSLPAVFGTTLETVPWPGAYLGPSSRSLVPSFPGSLLSVGLCWSGNPRYKSDAQRSVRLGVLLPLLRTPGVRWVSLQKGPAANQIAGLPSDVAVADGASRDSDLADTASMIAGLDAVVTTDTSIAHLAGAMGKPVFLLLSHLSDWRWMQDSASTPWYPTARLLRQRAPGDWNSVLAIAAEELAAPVRSR
ncbi:MAG TPA: tetratricopeptide repeat protein [Terracidiphilus sp.]|jgi:tetratricopeptide (TPR) repeat protein|nr:tetratricopeptide repeat protein [Terracidiphilus sp.]